MYDMCMHSGGQRHAISGRAKYIIAGIVSSVILSGIAWLGVYVWGWQHRPHVLEVHFLSVDSGVVVFIRTPEGKSILIDGGKGQSIFRALSTAMPFYERSIDVFVLSTNDDAHQSALSSVQGRFSVGNIISSSTEGDSISLGELNALVLFPATSSYSFTKTNAPSLAFSLQYGSTTFIYGGLVTKSEQKYIATKLATSTGGNTVLFLPRGENTGAVAPDFFNKISPDYVVDYKKPRTSPRTIVPATLATSTRNTKPAFTITGLGGLTIYNVATEGDVVFISDGKKFVRTR